MSTIFSDTTGRQLIKTKKLATWADLIGSNRFRPTPDQIRADQNPSERFFTGLDLGEHVLMCSASPGLWGN
jgi:hypothetical protein